MLNNHGIVNNYGQNSLIFTVKLSFHDETKRFKISEPFLFYDLKK